MVRMVFEQCLCCFRYNPEVWLSLAHFEREQGLPPTSSGGTQNENEQEKEKQDKEEQSVVQARNVYLEAIDANPTVTLLRAALSELEEAAGNLETAKEVLRVTFEQTPCGFTFALLQRFIRRNLGIGAARRLFTETLLIRTTNPKIGLEVSTSMYNLLFNIHQPVKSHLQHCLIHDIYSH